MPPETTPNPASESADAETHEQGSDEAALAAFSAKETPEETEPEAETGDETAAEDSPEEADEADPEGDTDPAAEVVEVEFEGKTYSVAPELEKALLRQSDYSRQMNAVKSQEAVYKQRLESLETIEKTAEKRAESLAEIKSIDAQIKSYEGINWVKAKADNPGEAALAAVELMSLQQQRQIAEAKSKTLGDEFSQERQKLIGEQRADMEKVLTKDLKGWGPEKGQELTTYAVKTGVKVETLQALTDPQIVIALDKARQWDSLQAKKTELKATVKAPPVLKPGAPRKIDPKTDAMSRLRKTNSDDDAVAAFLSTRK